MAQYSAVGNSIEGKKILLAGRVIVPSGAPSKDPITGKLRFGVQVKRLGAAKILVAFKPAKTRLMTTSHVAKDTVLKGNQLFGSSYSPFNVGQRKKGGAGRTHSHSGQDWTMEGDCLALIEIDWIRSASSIALTPSVVSRAIGT